ncbi:hypothetical protein GIB67_003708 [Kingdonia uniflora]|uniref:Uncharacterized protein n=1 Tax=Kingdonia uniflora TaxID=39325 RepID=A0A7J7M415_9MAGN|nr:hypothetical protein GIB67_003708 [Kingdonia uniflora]
MSTEDITSKIEKMDLYFDDALSLSSTSFDGVAKYPKGLDNSLVTEAMKECVRSIKKEFEDLPPYFATPLIMLDDFMGMAGCNTTRILYNNGHLVDDKDDLKDYRIRSMADPKKGARDCLVSFLDKIDTEKATDNTMRLRLDERIKNPKPALNGCEYTDAEREKPKGSISNLKDCEVFCTYVDEEYIDYNDQWKELTTTVI